MVSPFRRLKLDPQLACEFLGVFARFEFALKTGGFAEGDETDVRPKWSEFARAVDGRFNPDSVPELNEAVDYLLNQPPKKQVLIDNRLDWRAAPPDANLPRAERVLLMVRRVRNNLFHGGKFLSAEGEADNRDELLVQYALATLKACIPLNAHVAAAYGN